MKKQILILFVVLLSATTFAQAPQKEKHVNTKNGLAIQGYDPVAYFQKNQATKGNKEITANYQDAVYYFSSKENRETFLQDPSHYVPQYGGFCAYGMSEGYEAPIQPEAFTIVNDKLYLNYNLKVKETWYKEKENRIERANKNWEKE